jgi:hypothetical protein
MDEQDSELTKNFFQKSFLNNIVSSILEDPEMTFEFVVEPSQNKPEQT